MFKFIPCLLRVSLRRTPALVSLISATALATFIGPVTIGSLVLALGSPIVAHATTVFVIPTQTWTDTGLSVRDGEHLSISASGELIWQDFGCAWPNSNNCTSGPAGPGPTLCADFGPAPYPAPNLPCNSLIGKVGTNGVALEVGTSLDTTVSANGELYLGVNDWYLPDNAGGWTATVNASGSTTPEPATYLLLGLGLSLLVFVRKRMMQAR